MKKNILGFLLSFVLAYSIFIAQAQETTSPEIYFKIDNVIFAKSSDIAFYDTINNTIQFSTAKRLEFEQKEIPVAGSAFSIYVDRELIFEGKIFSIESSSSCDCIAIVRTIPLSELPPLFIELGYPTEKFFTGKDLRNSIKLITALSERKIPVKQ